MNRSRRNHSALLPSLFPLGMSVAVSLLGDLTVFASLVTRLDSLQLTLPQLGILFSIHRIIRIPLNPIVGRLADRVGRRPLFVTGMLLAVLSTAGYGFSIGFLPFLFFRLTWGVAWSLINTTGMTITMDISSQDGRGKLAGVYNAWMWVGFALAPLFGGFLVDQIPFRQAMLVLAGFTAIGLVVSFLRLPETLPRREEPVETNESPQRVKFGAVSELLRTFNWQAMIVLAIFLFTGEGLLLATVSLLLTDRFGAQISLGSLSMGIATAAGALLMLRAVLGSASGPLAGHLSDRRGRLVVTSLSALLGAASLIILIYAGTLAWILVGILLSAIVSGAGGSVLTAWVGDTSDQAARGAIFGWFTMIGDIGSGLGPLFAFLIYPRFGLAPAYWTGAFLFVVAAIWLNRTRISAMRANASGAG